MPQTRRSSHEAHGTGARMNQRRSAMNARNQEQEVIAKKKQKKTLLKAKVLKVTGSLRKIVGGSRRQVSEIPFCG